MHTQGAPMSATMRATVYPSPGDEFPHVAVVFHTDGTILLARPFATADDAQRYLSDVSSSLVAISNKDGTRG
jgi:hypothetical protein